MLAIEAVRIREGRRSGGTCIMLRYPSSKSDDEEGHARESPLGAFDPVEASLGTH